MKSKHHTFLQWWLCEPGGNLLRDEEKKKIRTRSLIQQWPIARAVLLWLYLSSFLTNVNDVISPCNLHCIKVWLNIYLFVYIIIDEYCAKQHIPLICLSRGASLDPGFLANPKLWTRHWKNTLLLYLKWNVYSARYEWCFTVTDSLMKLVEENYLAFFKPFLPDKKKVRQHHGSPLANNEYIYTEILPTKGT